MEIIDNINHLLGDNLRQSIVPGAKLRIAVFCFSIYAFEALKGIKLIFTTPALRNCTTTAIRTIGGAQYVLARAQGFSDSRP